MKYKLSNSNTINYTSLAAKVRAAGGIVVNEKWRFERRIHSFLEREDRGFTILSIHIDKDLDAHVSQLPCSWNRRSRYLDIRKDNVLLAEDGSMGIVERHSRNLIQISVESFEGLAFFAEANEAGETIPRRIFRAPMPDGTEGLFVESPVSDGMAWNLLSGEEIPLEEVTSNPGTLIYNDPEVGCSTTTAGTLKQKALVCVCSNLPGFDPWQVWNRLLAGAPARCLDGHKGSYKEVAQMSTRMSAFEAPAAELAPIGVTAYYMGKIQREGVGVGGDSEKQDLVDGLGWWASEYAAQSFSNRRTNVLVTPSAVEGSAAQMRPHDCKLLALIMRRHGIAAVMNSLGAEFVYLYRDEITPEVQAAFDLCFSKEKDADGNSLCKTSPFYGKVVVIAGSRGESTDVDFFTDLNGLKCSFDLRYTATCNILGISALHKAVETGSSFSSQVLDSMLILDEERTWEILAAHMEKFVEDKLNSIGYARNEKGELVYKDGGKGHPARMSDFAGESVDIGQLLQKLAPEFATNYWRPLFKRVGGNACNGMVSSLSNLKIPTSGAYLKVIPDPAAWIAGVNVLECHEDGTIDCFSTLLNRLNVLKAIGIKFPKMLDREYAKLMAMQLDAYKTKLYEKVEDQGLRDLIMVVMKTLSEGILVVPAVELLKNQLAGMDFDGDAIQVYTNPDVVDVFWQGDPLAVVIQ